MKNIKIKLIIPEFAIEEWIHLENGNKATLRYILDFYSRLKPITSPKGIAYSARSSYLYSLKYNNAPSGITTRNEVPSRFMGGIYVTLLWRCFYTNKSGTRYSGTYTRPGVSINTIINFKDGDQLSLSLFAISSSVPI